MRLTNIIDQLKDEAQKIPNNKKLMEQIKNLEEFQALNIAKLRDIENLTTKLRILS